MSWATLEGHEQTQATRRWSQEAADGRIEAERLRCDAATVQPLPWHTSRGALCSVETSDTGANRHAGQAWGRERRCSTWGARTA